MSLNERIFEFTINLELTKYFGVPFIPTPIMEQKCGFDALYINSGINMVHMNGLSSKKAKFLLLQFKISEDKQLTNLKRYKSPDYPSLSKWTATNVLRFKMHYSHKLSDPFNQHNTLKRLAGLSGIKAYYCAPRFTTFYELYQYSAYRNVINNSIFVDVNHLKSLHYGSSHHLYFNYFGNDYVLCSDYSETQNENLSFDVVINDLNNLHSVLVSEAVETLRKELNLERKIENSDYDIFISLVQISKELSDRFNIQIACLFDN